MTHPCRKCHALARSTASVTVAPLLARGDHAYLIAGTVFEDTRMPLQSWFYAIYVFVAVRHGFSGKELHRQRRRLAKPL